MEELVTVDEVGEEDDSIIEPDLPEIDEDTAGPKPVLEKEAVEEHVPMPPLSPEQDVDKKTNQEKSCVESMDRKHTYITDDKENVVPATVPEEQKSANQSQAPKQSLDHSSNSPCQDIKTALEETSLEDKVPNSDLLEPHVTMSDTSKSQDTLHVTETITNGLQHKDGKKGTCLCLIKVNSTKFKQQNKLCLQQYSLCCHLLFINFSIICCRDDGHLTSS